MAEFTKEQLIDWANSLIEETHTDISISRTDAHAESYRAQLALLEIALAALTAQEDNRIEYTRRVEAELITARARIALLEGLK